MLAKQAKAADAGGLLPPVARTGRHLLASRHAHPHLRLPRARSLDPRVSAVTVPAAERPPVFYGVPPPALRVWAGLLVGAALVCLDAAWARTHATDTVVFVLFWLGVLRFLLPAAAYLCRPEVLRGERLALVAATGLFCSLPRFLLDPGSPVGADELASWRRIEDIFATGSLDRPSALVPALDGFPGLHVLAAALRSLSGLSSYAVGVVLVTTGVVLSLLGVFLLAERLLGSARLGSLAAVVYATSPSLLFLDTQLSFEAIGLPLAIWTLVAVGRIHDPRATRAAQLGWFGVALLLGVAVIVTHALSGIFLFLLLAAIVVATVVALAARCSGHRQGVLFAVAAVALCAVLARLIDRFELVVVASALVLAGAGRGVRAILRSGPGTGRTAGAVLTVALTALFALAAGLWLDASTSGVIPLLTPQLDRLPEQLLELAQRESAVQQLVAPPAGPQLERVLVYLAPLVAALLVLLGLRTLPGMRPRGPLVVALSLVGCAYLVTVPFVLHGVDAAGARRGWSFGFLGVALLAAMALGRLLERRRSITPLLARRVLVPAFLTVLMVGNVAAGPAAEYRFPGPFSFGSDARSLTQETRTAVRWFERTQGPARRVIADRSTSVAFAFLGGEDPQRASTGYPLWEFTFAAARPSANVLVQTQSRGVEFLIIDKRMTSLVPRIGYYYDPSEPAAGSRSVPPPQAAIAKYGRVPWASRIYESDHLAIYRLDYGVLGTCGDKHRVEPGVRCP